MYECPECGSMKSKVVNTIDTSDSTIIELRCMDCNYEWEEEV